MMKTALALAWVASVQATDPYWSSGQPDGVFTSSTTVFTTTPFTPPDRTDGGGGVVISTSTFPTTTSPEPVGPNRGTGITPMVVITTEAPEGSSFPWWAGVLIVVGLAVIAALAALLLGGKPKPKQKRSAPQPPPAPAPELAPVVRAPAPAPAPAPISTISAPIPVATQSMYQQPVQTVYAQAPPVYAAPVQQMQQYAAPVQQMQQYAAPVQQMQQVPQMMPVQQVQQVQQVVAAPVAAQPVDSVIGMACHVCGNIYMEDSNFCRKCGAHRPGRPMAPGGIPSQY